MSQPETKPPSGDTKKVYTQDGWTSDPDLVARVEKLEREVADLRRLVRDVAGRTGVMR